MRSSYTVGMTTFVGALSCMLRFNFCDASLNRQPKQVISARPYCQCEPPTVLTFLDVTNKPVIV